MYFISGILSLIQEIIYYLRVQNYHEGCMRFRDLLGRVQKNETIRNALYEEENILQIVMSQMLQALEKDDMILLADLLDEVLTPVLKEMVVLEEVVKKGKYELETASSGYLTVKHLPSNLYLHSNVNPMEEARILVEQCYTPEKEQYAVWGVGLGYHIKRLYEVARGAIEIVVFDEDAELMEIAKKSGIMAEIPEHRIEYNVDEKGQKFAQYIAENDTGILIHFPSVKKIQNKGLKDAMHQFFSGWNSTVQVKTELAVNFRSNRKRCKYNVDELRESFQGKDIIIVAAGPSLDRTIDFLQKNLGKKTIIAVTTVLKKLLELGITPDYAVVMDSQKRTIGQIEGMEESSVPLIVDSTAYWEFADKYAGEKYIAWQKGYVDAEKCAADAGANTYDTGGSVTTLALDIALKLGAGAIYFVGVDLAYPNGVSHADNTMDKHIRDTSGMERVRAVDGNWVYADTLFVGYRKWIEAKIAQYPNIPCYNLSDCGAEIVGTIAIEL